MAARDEPATIPPPVGEDNAYEAATKVGAMPAEVMARLRAEGLLPEEQPEPPVPSQAPNSSLHRPAPASTGEVAPSSDRPVPQVFSSAPPPVEEEEATSIASSEALLALAADAGMPLQAEPPPVAAPASSPPSPSPSTSPPEPKAIIVPIAPIESAPVVAPAAPSRWRSVFFAIVVLALVAFFVAWLRSRG